MTQRQVSRYEARAIATISFLLKDDKGRGDRLEHAWNVHLSSAPRGTQNFARMFCVGRFSDTDGAEAATDSEGKREEDTEGQQQRDAAVSLLSAACKQSALASSGPAAAGQLSCHLPARMLVSTSSCCWQRSMAADPKIKGAVPCSAGLQLQADKVPDAACADMLAALPTARLRDEQHSNSSSAFVTSSPAGNSGNSTPAGQQEAQQQQPPATTAQITTDIASVPALLAPSAPCAGPPVAEQQPSSADASRSKTVGLISQDAGHGGPAGVHAAVTTGVRPSYEEEEALPTPKTVSRCANKALFLLWDVQAGCKLPPPCLPAVPKPISSLPPGAKPYVSLNTALISRGTRHGSRAGVPSTATVTSQAAAAPAAATASAPADALDQLMAALPAGNDSWGSNNAAVSTVRSPVSAHTTAPQPTPAAESPNSSAARCQSALPPPASNSHIHWAQEQPAGPGPVQASNPKRNQSARPSAAAIASVGLPSASTLAPVGAAAGAGAASGAGTGSHMQAHRNSGSAVTISDPTNEPTYEDIQRYIKVGYGEEGVEAFIQRRLQQAALDDAAAAGKKTVPRAAASQQYLKVMVAKHRRQVQA